MWEAAVIYVQSADGWTEIPTNNANRLFQRMDAQITIFLDGSWSCVYPHAGALAHNTGNLNNLERYLQNFNAANPL
jgi:hypothetical protein